MDRQIREMDIEDLIPHRGRMKLLDSVVSATDDEATTSARVTPRWPLFQDAFVNPIVLIEVVAQTAAVHVSSRKKAGETVDRRGWMVGIKNADFYSDAIPVDTVLTTTVKNLYHIDNYNVLEGEVRDGEMILCRVQIQVMRETVEGKTLP
ncbi:MAG: hypothetical protein CSYNP_00103 [Syntrophus sp. SKADARSKE-3]|nr:hypothetical protein [Syntrophus sp. SKADARSKE-3]